MTRTAPMYFGSCTVWARFSPALSEKGPKKRFAVLEVDTDTEVVGYEPILKHGEVVGHVTSGGYGHYVGRSLAIGYVKAEHYEDSGEFAIDIFGVDRPAILRKAPLHDPNGGRLRG